MDQNQNRSDEERNESDDLFNFGGSSVDPNTSQPQGAPEQIPYEPVSESEPTPVVPPFSPTTPETVGGARIYDTADEPGAYTPPPATPPARTGGLSRNWIIAIIVAVVLCCCCLGFAAFMWFWGGDALIQGLGSAPVFLSLV